MRDRIPGWTDFVGCARSQGIDVHKFSLFAVPPSGGGTPNYFLYRVRALTALRDVFRFGFHRNCSRSQRPASSNLTPSRSSIRCCLSAGSTMRPVEHLPCELITRCHGVLLSSAPCITKPTVRGV